MITIHIEGLDAVAKSLGAMADKLPDTMQAAGREAAERVILPTVGLKRYPPESEANRPPAPYYERGRGTIRADGTSLGGSERLGTQWYVDRYSQMGVVIGNRASYAPFVNGPEQAWFHAPRGWRILDEVAEEKMQDIIDVYQAWIDRLIKMSGG